MVYYESTVTVFLKQSVSMHALPEQIGRFISRSMLLEPELKELHQSTGYKGYVYSGLYPIERKKQYKNGNVYIFRIRSFNSSLLTKLSQCLRKVNDDTFHVLAIEQKRHPRRFIQALSTITPVFATIDHQPWMPEQHGLDVLIERIHMNAEKKYQCWFGQIECSHSFVQHMELTNIKPIALHYKNVRLLGHKLHMIIQPDDISQKLAFTVLGGGLLEKNASLGAGFCHAVYL